MSNFFNICSKPSKFIIRSLELSLSGSLRQCQSHSRNYGPAQSEATPLIREDMDIDKQQTKFLMSDDSCPFYFSQ
jgi:hypothetical protein